MSFNFRYSPVKCLRPWCAGDLEHGSRARDTYKCAVCGQEYPKVALLAPEAFRFIPPHVARAALEGQDDD